MRRGAKTRGNEVIALALTWDGARWPVRSLTVRAREFLLGQKGLIPPMKSRKAIADLFADDKIREIRICWVPRLKGGSDVLADPFAAPNGRRIGFRAVQTVDFEGILAVIYQRQ